MVTAMPLHAALRQLPELERLVVRLHWIEGVSMPDIAACLALTTPEAEQHATNALERLRTLLPAHPFDRDLAPPSFDHGRV
jgi:DNA-directed RNA polymerase specialized sigma24 family protein